MLEYKLPAIKGEGHPFPFYSSLIHVLNMLPCGFIYVFMKITFSLASMCGKWCLLILLDSVPIKSQNVSGNPDN